MPDYLAELIGGSMAHYMGSVPVIGLSESEKIYALADDSWTAIQQRCSYKSHSISLFGKTCLGFSRLTMEPWCYFQTGNNLS